MVLHGSIHGLLLLVVVVVIVVVVVVVVVVVASYPIILVAVSCKGAAEIERLLSNQIRVCPVMSCQISQR
jgi:hypothetical protein